MKFYPPLSRLLLSLILSTSFILNDPICAMEDDDSSGFESGTPQPKETKRFKKKSKLNTSAPVFKESFPLSNSLEFDFIQAPAKPLKRLKKENKEH